MVRAYIRHQEQEDERYEQAILENEQAEAESEANAQVEARRK